MIFSKCEAHARDRRFPCSPMSAGPGRPAGLAVILGLNASAVEISGTIPGHNLGGPRTAPPAALGRQWQALSRCQEMLLVHDGRAGALLRPATA